MKKFNEIKKRFNSFEGEIRETKEKKYILNYFNHFFEEEELFLENGEVIPKHIEHFASSKKLFEGLINAYEYFLCNKELYECSFEYDEENFGNIEEFCKLYLEEGKNLKDLFTMSESGDFKFIKKVIHPKQLIILYQEIDNDFLDDFKHIDVLKFELSLNSLILFEGEIIDGKKTLKEEDFESIILENKEKIDKFIKNSNGKNFVISFLEEDGECLNLITQKKIKKTL